MRRGLHDASRNGESRRSCSDRRRSRGLKTGGLFVDMSSIAPAASRRIAAELAAGGIDALDAPVSGGEQVRSKQASPSWPAARSRVCAGVPLFEKLGTRAVRIGDAGAGQVAKCAIRSSSESRSKPSRSVGVSRSSRRRSRKVREACWGPRSEPHLERYGARMLASDYAPGARATLHLKDMTIAAQLAPKPASTCQECNSRSNATPNSSLATATSITARCACSSLLPRHPERSRGTATT